MWSRGWLCKKARWNGSGKGSQWKTKSGVSRQHWWMNHSKDPAGGALASAGNARWPIIGQTGYHRWPQESLPLQASHATSLIAGNNCVWPLSDLDAVTWTAHGYYGRSLPMSSYKRNNVNGEQWKQLAFTLHVYSRALFGDKTPDSMWWRVNGDSVLSRKLCYCFSSEQLTCSHDHQKKSWIKVGVVEVQLWPGCASRGWLPPIAAASACWSECKQVKYPAARRAGELLDQSQSIFFQNESSAEVHHEIQIPTIRWYCWPCN